MALSDTGVALSFGETPASRRQFVFHTVRDLSKIDIYTETGIDLHHGKEPEESLTHLPSGEIPISNAGTVGEKIAMNIQTKKQKHSIRFPSVWPFEWRDSEIPRLIGRMLSNEYASIPGLIDYDYDFSLEFVAEDDQHKSRYKAVFSIDVPALDKRDFSRIWNEAITIYESSVKNLRAKSKPGSRQRKDILSFYKIARIHIER